MDEQIKQDWIGALKSGEYTQGTHCLNNGTGMCCLGVLTDLYRKKHGGEWEPREGVPLLVLTGAEDEDMALPIQVRTWAKMESSVPMLPFLNREYEGMKNLSYDKTNIAELNDSGVPFNQIADLIEAFL